MRLVYHKGRFLKLKINTMGTSQRHNPSVKGQPNWGKSSRSLTAAIKKLEKLDKLENEIGDEDNNSVENVEDTENLNHTNPSILERRQRKTYICFHKDVSKSVKNLVRASGGRARVSSGSSHSLGYAGVKVLGNVLNAFAEIHQQGLAGWLGSKGLSLEGKSWEEIKDILVDLSSDEVVGLDETAANQAVTEMMDDLSRFIEIDSSNNMEEALQRNLSNEQITELVDKFFGVYVFAHLSQNFNEKLEKKYEQGQVAKYMLEIKDQIISDIRQGVNGHDAFHIDWLGEESHQLLIDEFERIISIFDDDED